MLSQFWILGTVFGFSFVCATTHASLLTCAWRRNSVLDGGQRLFILNWLENPLQFTLSICIVATNLLSGDLHSRANDPLWLAANVLLIGAIIAICFGLVTRKFWKPYTLILLVILVLEVNSYHLLTFLWITLCIAGSIGYEYGWVKVISDAKQAYYEQLVDEESPEERDPEESAMYERMADYQRRTYFHDLENYCGGLMILLYTYCFFVALHFKSQIPTWVFVVGSSPFIYIGLFANSFEARMGLGFAKWIYELAPNQFVPKALSRLARERSLTTSARRPQRPRS
jgi:hypothetical protein